MAYIDRWEQIKLVRDHDRRYEGMELGKREAIEFGFDTVPELLEPFLTTVKILDNNYAWGMKWRGDKTIMRPGFDRPQNVFLFEVLSSNIEETEVSGPYEWEVRFVGTIEDLINSPYASRFEIPDTANRGSWVALLTANHELYGIGSRPLHQMLFCCNMVMRVIDGYVPVDEGSHEWHIAPEWSQCNPQVIYPEKYSAASVLAVA